MDGHMVITSGHVAASAHPTNSIDERFTPHKKSELVGVGGESVVGSVRLQAGWHGRRSLLGVALLAFATPGADHGRQGHCILEVFRTGAVKRGSTCRE